MSTKKTVGIYTLGCKVNQYESRAIAEELERRGVTLSRRTVAKYRAQMNIDSSFRRSAEEKE